MARQRRAMKKERGVAILLALFFMILLSMIGIALIGMVPVELRSSTRTKLDVQAHYAVTSGIRHARSWCSAVMTPTSVPGTPDFLGDSASTTGNSFYYPSGSYLNEITGIDGSQASVEYEPMTLEDVFSSNRIPTSTSKWSDSYQMLNLASAGVNRVDPKTVVLVKKAPLQLGDWSAYTVIIPDADTPGGARTLDGSGKITSFFGGAGKSGRRCYQIVSIAFYQGFPTLRGKSTVLEDSFARYSLFVDSDPSQSWALQAIGGQVTTLGPVHTNGSFKFAIDPAVWTNTNGSVPFNGLLTFGTRATEAATSVDDALNHDGAVYSGGNERSSSNEANRPFNAMGGEIADRYSKMIAGGRSNLRQTAPVGLPPDSTKISNAAYGTGFVTAGYESAALAPHIAPGGVPDGVFVFPNASNKVAGGVVLKGDSERVFLEVVDNNGRPITDLGALENGSANGNPAIRTQGEERTKEVTSTQTITTSSEIVQTVTTGSTTTTATTSGTFRSTTGSTVVPSMSTGWGPYTTTGSTSFPRVTTRYLTTVIPTTSVSTRVTTTGFTTLTTGSTVITVGGAGANIQTSYLTTRSPLVTTILSTISSNRTSTTGSTVSTTGWSTSYLRTRTRTTVSTSRTNYLTTMVTTSGVTSGVLPLTTVQTSMSTGVFTDVQVATETFRPIDQVIEAKNVAVNLNPTMFQANGPANYQTPAGANGHGSDMDVSKLSGITELLVSSGSGLTPLAATSVGPGNVVVIKQSRSNPAQAVVFIFPADANDEGALLNGAVYTEGYIGTRGDFTSSPKQRSTGGVAGVNYGRKTIGGQIENASATPNPDGSLFGRQPTAPSVAVGIENNLWQYGTKVTENDTNLLKAEHGLGLVAEEIRVNAKPNDFTSFWSAQAPDYTLDRLLNIHAVLLGGSNTSGGLTINGFKDVNDLTPGNLGASATNTPYIRFVGGLILRNYYARINGFSQAGWNSMNIYNQQLALKPPPYFPNNGLLIPLSYIEERIWSEQSL